jgi:hypothetical protein
VLKRSFLQGHVKPGMFSDERVVVFTDYQGNKALSIVQTPDVATTREGQASIEVRVLDTSDDLTLVMLPGEVLSPSRTIAVRTSELSSSGPSLSRLR